MQIILTWLLSSQKHVWAPLLWVIHVVEYGQFGLEPNLSSQCQLRLKAWDEQSVSDLMSSHYNMP